MNTIIKFSFSVLFLIGFSFHSQAQSSRTEAQFQSWLNNELWPQAKARGVSKSTFDRALSGVTLNWKIPGLVPPGSSGTPKKQGQAEFGAPSRYFNENNVGAVVAGGRARAKTYARLLRQIERKYGVPGRIVLAIWGRETGYGRAKIPHNAFRVLATKAFMSTRKDLFRQETLAALEIVQRGFISSDKMKSSWAGAMGQPQFLPTSYLKYAVDFDGDGRKDIWNSVPDALASIANYLNQHGWKRNRDWGFEVEVPANISCALEGPDQGKRISDWAKAGVGRISGKPFPRSERRQNGYLLMPAGRLGPSFIATENFYVIKTYNESDLYALFIGHVGDRIQWGNKKFQSSWGRVDKLYRSDIAAMQRRLESYGYDVGGADGLPGFKTRRSTGAWQAKNGLTPTCFPSASLVQKLR